MRIKDSNLKLRIKGAFFFNFCKEIIIERNSGLKCRIMKKAKLKGKGNMELFLTE